MTLRGFYALFVCAPDEFSRSPEEHLSTYHRRRPVGECGDFDLQRLHTVEHHEDHEWLNLVDCNV